jgi:hypothetical protein
MVSVTQSLKDIGVSSSEELVRRVNRTKPYQEWQYQLKTGDRLPRGKFFVGKKAGSPRPIILDEGRILYSSST